MFAANLSEARGRGTIPQLDEDALARPGQQGSLADRIRARNAAKVNLKMFIHRARWDFALRGRNHPILRLQTWLPLLS